MSPLVIKQTVAFSEGSFPKREVFEYALNQFIVSKKHVINDTFVQIGLLIPGILIGPFSGVRGPFPPKMGPLPPLG